MTSMTNSSADNMGNLFASSPHFSCCGSLKLTLPGQLNTPTIMASDASEWNEVADGSVSKCDYTWWCDATYPPASVTEQDTCHSTQHAAYLWIICANHCQRIWHIWLSLRSLYWPLLSSLPAPPTPTLNVSHHPVPSPSPSDIQAHTETHRDTHTHVDSLNQLCRSRPAAPQRAKHDISLSAVTPGWSAPPSHGKITVHHDYAQRCTCKNAHLMMTHWGNYAPSQCNRLACDMSAHIEHALHAPCWPRTNTYASFVETQTHRDSSWRAKQIRSSSPVHSHAKPHKDIQEVKSLGCSGFFVFFPEERRNFKNRGSQETYSFVELISIFNS